MSSANAETALPSLAPPPRASAALSQTRPPGRKLGEPEFARIPDHRWHGRVSDRLVVALFAAAILVPFVVFFRAERSALSLSENRNLAPPPNFSWGNRGHWAEEIDAFYRDHFAYRAHLVRWEAKLRAVKLGASNKDLLIGRDRWAFYTREGNFENHMGLAPFTADQLSEWKDYLERRHDLLARKGSQFLFVIAPDKETIYPEQLPDAIRHALRPDRLGQLMAHLRATGSKVSVLPLHDVLRAAKSEGLVYFPQDTHWNGRGFFYANQAIARFAQERWFPDLPIPTLAPDYEIKPMAWEGGEWNLVGLPDENGKFRSEFLIRKTPLLSRLGRGQLPDNWQEIPQPWLAPLWFSQPTGRHRVVVLHDSFMRTGNPDRNQMPLAESFAQSLFIGSLPGVRELSSLVERERPELVILELVERHLQPTPPPDTPEAMDLGLD